MIQKPEYTLEKPDVQRDAPFAVEWLSGSTGKENREAIGSSFGGEVTLANATDWIKASVSLEAEQRQLTWIIRADGKSIGIIWLNLEDTEDVPAPAVYIMIGDPAYRSKGIGHATMKETIRYAYGNLPFAVLYSRYLVSNTVIEKLYKKLGFEKDSDSYEDEDGLKWQNVQLVL